MTVSNAFTTITAIDIYNNYNKNGNQRINITKQQW